MGTSGLAISSLRDNKLVYSLLPRIYIYIAPLLVFQKKSRICNVSKSCGRYQGCGVGIFFGWPTTPSPQKL